MPTYEYACTACAEELEVVQKFSDDPLTECAVCGGRLRKRFSPVGIVFKGSGFYRTDSRSGSTVNGGKPKEGAASGAAASGDKPASSDSSSSSDAKPAKKADAASGGSSSSGSGSAGSSGSSTASTKVA